MGEGALTTFILYYYASITYFKKYITTSKHTEQKYKAPVTLSQPFLVFYFSFLICGEEEEDIN